MFPHRPRFAGVATAGYKSALRDRQALDREAWGAIVWVSGRQREITANTVTLKAAAHPCEQSTKRARFKTRERRATEGRRLTFFVFLVSEPGGSLLRLRGTSHMMA